MHFAHLPDVRAQRDPDGPALADTTNTVCNVELAAAVHAAAEQFGELGIGAGDVVALKLINRVEFVVVLFAAWRLGAVVTPINPAATESETAHQLRDSRARLVVVEQDGSPIGGIRALAVDDLRRTAVGAPAPAHDDPAALALLIYTSGTTGVPKGVMLDHANLDAMTQMGAQALTVTAADRSLLILPLFHVNGIVVSILMSLRVGASVFIADRFNPTTFFDVIERERPTFFSAVPTIYSMLAALPEEVRPDTSAVRFALCGAAPASADLLVRFADRFGFPLVEAYGLSEGTCGTTTNPVDGLRKPGTVGLPFPGQEVRIVDSAGNELPSGEAGEITVRGPNVMRGYLGRPQDTAAVIVDGWLRTGDVGRLDEDGYLSVVGRFKEMIIRGGENIYPKEIEDVLAADPDVLEAAVVGVADEKWGEVVVAFVQARAGAELNVAALEERCKQHLSGFKRPSAIHVLSVLPKNAVGKLDKKALRGIGSGR
ncbi:long-chain fatty acid--CoA ligase [Gordonia sp. TBRC 11910]|uniref:Long-chain fatty acid--CoA ligase n=1 Tax=Gordonia asplenii TaxID=2725283 RepID=A0A848KVP9_9ACTN|nr:AMP-binding protein [Gordonia asplenii]NMO02746.1 long-chain fatty acid--CoA ligase [Gordonia asplenii]